MGEGRDLDRHATTAVRGEFSLSEGGWKGTATEFPRTREWLHKAEVTITSWNGSWLTGRMTGAMGLGEEDAGEERRPAAREVDDVQKIFALVRKEYRANGTCSFMDTPRFCHCVYTDKFGRTIKEGARSKEAFK